MIRLTESVSFSLDFSGCTELWVESRNASKHTKTGDLKYTGKSFLKRSSRRLREVRNITYMDFTMAFDYVHWFGRLDHMGSR